MKTLKMILKGMLLYITALAVVLFISGVDSIYDAGYFIHGILVCAVLCYLCYKYITAGELEVLTLNKWVDKITGGKSDDLW